MKFVPRIYCIVAALAVTTQTWAVELSWYWLSRENGCVSLKEMYQSFPYLRQGRTPTELLVLFRKEFNDAKIRPFIEVIAAEQKKDGTSPDEEERNVYKRFDRTNAFLLSSERTGVEVALFTDALCRSIGGLRGE